MRLLVGGFIAVIAGMMLAILVAVLSGCSTQVGSVAHGREPDTGHGDVGSPHLEGECRRVATPWRAPSYVCRYEEMVCFMNAYDVRATQCVPSEEK